MHERSAGSPVRPARRPSPSTRLREWLLGNSKRRRAIPGLALGTRHGRLGGADIAGAFSRSTKRMRQESLGGDPRTRRRGTEISCWAARAGKAAGITDRARAGLRVEPYPETTGMALAALRGVRSPKVDAARRSGEAVSRRMPLRRCAELAATGIDGPRTAACRVLRPSQVAFRTIPGDVPRPSGEIGGARAETVLGLTDGWQTDKTGMVDRRGRRPRGCGSSRLQPGCAR